MSKSKINLGKLEDIKDVPRSRYAKLTYPESSYYPDILQSGYSEKQLRSEYTRLRDVAQKRIKRLGASEFSESSTYKKWKDGVPKLRDLQSVSDIAHGLSELASFVQSPYSTVSGQRSAKKEQAATIEKHFPGLDLSGGNFDKFTSFMNKQVNNNLEKIFGSDRAVILFNVLQSKGITNVNPFISSPAKMAYWLNNVENLAAVDLPKGKYKSAKAYKELVESEIAHGRDRTPFRVSGVDDIIRQDRKRGRTNKRGRANRKRK